MDVTAVRVADIDEPGMPLGAFELMTRNDSGEIGGMLFVCPCGCGTMGELAFRPADPPFPSWDWDGNRDQPTLEPSIQRTHGCRWHGHLKAGVWIPC